MCVPLLLERQILITRLTGSTVQVKKKAMDVSPLRDGISELAFGDLI